VEKENEKLDFSPNSQSTSFQKKNKKKKINKNKDTTYRSEGNFIDASGCEDWKA